MTGADVAKAERRARSSTTATTARPGSRALLDAFRKDFPKIKTSYVRAQTGALYAKVTAERSASRYGGGRAPALRHLARHRLPEEGRLRAVRLPGARVLQGAATRARPGGYFTWMGVTFAGISYNKSKVKPEQAPKTWKDMLNPIHKDGMSAKLSTSGMQHMQWYMLRKLYGADFWQEFGKLRPRGFDARAQLFDRLAKGDDRICGLAEYAGYTLFKEKGADIEFVAPPDGLPATPALIGVVNRAPHPEAAKLFVDWALSNRGQAVNQTQTHPALRLGQERRARRWRRARSWPTSSCSSPPTGPTSRPATPSS